MDMQLELTKMNLKPPVANSSPGGDDQLKRLKTLKKACADFESIFVNSMVQSMKSAIPKSGLFGETAGFDIYDSMAEQQLAIYLSQGSGLGLGQTIFNQMVRREGLEDLDQSNPALGGYRFTRIIPSDMVKNGKATVSSSPPKQDAETPETIKPANSDEVI